MDAETLEMRMREVGVADTAAWPVGATIRPDLQPAETIPAATLAKETARALPRLSVDLRGSGGGTVSPPSSQGGADLEVRAVIGEGGMGRVFLARQHSLSRDVAVKTAKDGSTGSARDAILAEGRITGQLEHPAIVPVHALGVDAEGRPAMVMKRIEGVTWDELARDAAHQGWEGWEGDADDRLPGHLQILAQICNAVHFAHSRGVVHRDIKLENVLIGRFGDVYLADWGIASPLGERCERLSGTPGYMAPEMVDGRIADERTDVYLLGATLHELLTGEMRHGGRTAMAAILEAKLSEPHAYERGVPRELAELANRACRAEPSERPADAKVFRAALLDYASHRQSAALASEAAERVARLGRSLSDATPDEEQRREIDRLTAEARFGLDTALTQWPDNAVARHARAELEAILESRRAHTAALEREARERDPRISARARAIGLTLFGVLNIAFGIAAVRLIRVPSRLELVLYPFMFGGIIAAGAYVQRKEMLATRFNRQAVLLLFVLLGVIAVGRVFGVAAGVPAAELLARDSFVMAAGMAVGAIAFLRWLTVIAIVCLVGGIIISFLPEHALSIFSVANAVAILVAAGFQWRAG